MRGFSFIINNEYFIVDVDVVHKTTQKLMVTPVPSAPEEIIGISNIKGKVITIFNLYRLLGHNERRKKDYNYRAVKAVIFKTLSNSAEQLGLLIDKPGNLVEIDDNAVKPPVMPAGSEESSCICGIAEINNMLFRIISIDSIIKKYKLNGGIENEEII